MAPEVVKPAAGPRVTKPTAENSDSNEAQKLVEVKKEIPKKDVEAMVQELMPQALAAQGEKQNPALAAVSQDLSDAPEGGAVVQEIAQDIPEIDQN